MRERGRGGRRIPPSPDLAGACGDKPSASSREGRHEKLELPQRHRDEVRTDEHPLLHRRPPRRLLPVHHLTSSHHHLAEAESIATRSTAGGGLDGLVGELHGWEVKDGGVGPIQVVWCAFGKKKKQLIDEENKGENKRKKKDIMDISSSYPPYTARRSHFVKHFLKTAPALQEEPLYRRSRSQNRFQRSSPPKQILPEELEPKTVLRGAALPNKSYIFSSHRGERKSKCTT